MRVTGHLMTKKPYNLVNRRPVRKIIIPIGPSIAYVPLTQGRFALIDSADAVEVGKYNWCAHKDYTTGKYYAERCAGRKTLTMHRFLLNPREGFVADHVYSNTLDNRRALLREATIRQNVMNSALSSKNTSGYKGVSWNKAQRKFVAYIGKNRSFHYLGIFDTAEEAAEKVRVARAELHGEFARVA
jgi:hypothetical protein